MKKSWICLCLGLALCLPLAGCAGDKTGSMTPTPTAGVTGNPSGTTSGQPLVTDPPEEDRNTPSASPTETPLEKVGDGVEDALDDLGNGARRMAQNAKRTME